MTPEAFDDLAVTYAMLLGAEIAYDDYNHPERAGSRKYWSVRNSPPDAYGFTKALCAISWLDKKGYWLTRAGALNHNPNGVTR